MQIVSHELERQPNGSLHYDRCYDPEDPESKMGAVDAYASARFPTKFAYAKSLLRYYRPNFDDLPDEERQALIKRTCQLINENRTALRKLLAFAEYGTPGKKMVNPLENVSRDVQAAVLADVEKLSHADVGEQLGIVRTEYL